MTTDLNPVHTGPARQIVPVQSGPAAPVVITTTGTGSSGVVVKIIHDGNDMYFEQDFPTPQGDWLVHHNLGKRPNVTLLDENGNEFLADINFPDVDTVHVTFPNMLAGKVICS